MLDPATVVATATAKPIIAKLIDSLLKPAVIAGRLVSDPLIDTFTDRFSEYLSRQYLKHSHLPTIVFQSRRPIEDLYIPITVTEGGRDAQDKDSNRFVIDRYHPEFLPKLERVLLIDDAGMGKTTASRFLLVEATKTRATIPVFIELRHLSAEKTVLDFMLAELNQVGVDSSDLKIDKRQVIRLLEKGVFTFLLDGYDEISTKNREEVTLDIKRVVDTYPQNKFLLTSRPEHALASFPSFKAFKIEPLTREEAYTLIRKYDKNGERANRLIERLEDKQLDAVHEFLQNPLLTTLLYRAYDYKNQIPLKKPVFYRQVYDALYEWHDLTKDGYASRTKACGLDVDGFHRILRGLGFISVMKGAVEADTDEILNWIREARKYAPELRFSESDFLEDAIKAVPVLRREGNFILWAHKSLAEYFAAQFIATDSKKDQERICRHIAGSRALRGFTNVLDLLYDIDVGLFGQYFTTALIEHLYKEISSLKEKFPDYPAAQLERRACVTAVQRIVFLNSEKHITDIFGGSTMSTLANVVNDEWFASASATPIEKKFPNGISMEFQGFSKLRTLSFNHPLRTVLAVLIEKKNPIILQHQFYPANVNKAEIVGLRTGPRIKIINNDPASIWNSPKNFERTTFGLQRTMLGIINFERIAAAMSEIKNSTEQSQTTTALLESLCK